MTAPTQPLREVTREAIAILVRTLGSAQTIRFLNQYRRGTGDYTAERHTFLTNAPLEELLEQARRVDRGDPSALP